jgi:hypothetical protein
MIKLEVNKEYKMVTVSDVMAHTTANIFKVIAFADDRIIIIYKNPSGRYSHKRFYLTQKKDIIILPLDQCILKTDSETGSFIGNACFNFVNTESEIKEQLKKNLNFDFQSRYYHQENIPKINKVDSEGKYTAIELSEYRNIIS